MRELGSRDEDRQLSSVQEPVEGITLTIVVGSVSMISANSMTLTRVVEL